MPLNNFKIKNNNNNCIILNKKSELPKSWEDFCNKNPNIKNEWYISASGDIVGIMNNTSNYIIKKNLLNSKEKAEAMLAFTQLIQLRDHYRNGWEPDWNNDELKYTMTKVNNVMEIVVLKYNLTMFSFQSEEIAKQFFSNFKDLLDKYNKLY